MYHPHFFIVLPVLTYRLRMSVLHVYLEHLYTLVIKHAVLRVILDIFLRCNTR